MKTEKVIVLSVLTFEGHDLRIIDHNGTRWFPAKEVCNGLGLKNVTEALKPLKEREVDKINLFDAIGRHRKQTIISEHGAWRLAMRSDKPEADRFRDWLVYEVLPSLQKTGTYSMPGALPPPAPVTDLAVAREKRLAEKERRIAQDNRSREERLMIKVRLQEAQERAQALRRAAKIARRVGTSDAVVVGYELKAEEIIAGIPLGQLNPTVAGNSGCFTLGQISDRCGVKLHRVSEAIIKMGLVPDGHNSSKQPVYGLEKVTAIEVEVRTIRSGMTAIYTPPGS